VNLSVYERLVLLNILPKEGDYLTLKTVREAKEALAFDSDAEELGVTQTEQGVKCNDWNAERVIELSPRAVAVIVDVLTRLNKHEKLAEDQLSVYEKFVAA
jgi:hypothetical protein